MFEHLSRFLSHDSFALTYVCHFCFNPLFEMRRKSARIWLVLVVERSKPYPVAGVRASFRLWLVRSVQPNINSRLATFYVVPSYVLEAHPCVCHVELSGVAVGRPLHWLWFLALTPLGICISRLSVLVLEYLYNAVDREHAVIDLPMDVS